MDPKQRFFTAIECAKVLGMEPSRFLAKVKAGELPAGHKQTKRIDVWSDDDLTVMYWLEAGGLRRLKPITDAEERDRLEQQAET